MTDVCSVNVHKTNVKLYRRVGLASGTLKLYQVEMSTHRAVGTHVTDTSDHII